MQSLTPHQTLEETFDRPQLPKACTDFVAQTSPNGGGRLLHLPCIRICTGALKMREWKMQDRLRLRVESRQKRKL